MLTTQAEISHRISSQPRGYRDNLMALLAGATVGRALVCCAGASRYNPAIWLSERGWNVTLADFDQLFIDHSLAEMNDAARGYEHDWRGRLPESDATFDLVVSWSQIVHVPDPQFVLGECARILAPTGRMILASGYADDRDRGFWALFYGMLDGHRPLPGRADTIALPVYQYFARPDLDQLLGTSGFQILHNLDVEHYDFIDAVTDRHSCPEVGTAIRRVLEQLDDAFLAQLNLYRTGDLSRRLYMCRSARMVLAQKATSAA